MSCLKVGPDEYIIGFQDDLFWTNKGHPVPRMNYAGKKRYCQLSKAANRTLGVQLC